jgi:2-oxoisovalerate dehydrogenase E1 component alpha subunit
MLVKQCEEQVSAAWREAMTHGTMTDGPRLDPDSMFDDIFKDLTPHLAKQKQQLAAERANENKKAEKKDK